MGGGGVAKVGHGLMDSVSGQGGGGGGGSEGGCLLFTYISAAASLFKTLMCTKARIFSFVLMNLIKASLHILSQKFVCFPPINAKKFYIQLHISVLDNGNRTFVKSETQYFCNLFRGATLPVSLS